MTNCSNDTLLSTEDIQVLQKYCTGKQLVVELGTYKGGSARIISKCCKKLITIDTFPDFRPELEMSITFEAVKEILSDCKNVEVRKNDGIDEAANFAFCSVDAIFIDDGHKYETVWAEFGAWYSRLKHGGIFIFHDYITEIEYTNAMVRIAVDEILESGAEMLKKLEVKGQCLIAQKI